MEPKRTILCVDDGLLASELQLVLRTNGYRVLICKDERECWRELKTNAVDLVLISPRLQRFDESSCPVPTYRLDLDLVGLGGWGKLLERIRILLIRKRGPKPQAVASSRLSVASGPRAA
jgi:CheY-like chemotaxis protein